MSAAAAVAAGAVGGGLCAALLATRAPAARGAGLATLLAVAAGIYLGYGLTDGRPIQVAIQALGALPFVFVAAHHPPRIRTVALAWLAHGLWDVAHELGIPGTRVPTWYPGVCLSWDLALGGAALLWTSSPGEGSATRPSGPDGTQTKASP